MAADSSRDPPLFFGHRFPVGFDIRPRPPFAAPVSDVLGKKVLKGVSRSFYLTLRMLPVAMREAASVGYLLARTSDTLADTAFTSVPARLESLMLFAGAVGGDSDAPRWDGSLVETIADPKERRLLEYSEEIFQWLHTLPSAEAELVRDVVKTIVSGQALDLERFGHATHEAPVALESDAMLEDYAWRVAGCVGEFWTKLGFLTSGQNYSTASESVLLEKGASYGKGLQLVNILRDVVEDLSVGRCYLPVDDPNDIQAVLASHAIWCERALVAVADGDAYAETLHSRRLRAATALPALIARKTLQPLRGATWQNLAERIKIPRSEVYLSLFHSLRI